MKCPSIACLWPSSSLTSAPEGPPSHLITCSIALNSPPSLYTGASDGSIVFWSLLPLPSESSPHPLSILCGHSSPIAALAHSPDSLLISACTDAVLCVWSAAASRRCRLRRRLPPWAGSPSLIQTLPSSPHHLCILTTAPSLLLLDSSTLQLLHSHTLSPPLAVTSMTLLQNKDAILVDVCGAVLTLSLEKGSPPLGDTSNQEDESSLQRIRASAVSHDGRFLALVFDSRCVFKLVAGGVELGDVSCVSLMHPPVGVTFLEGELEDRAEIFVLWSSDGAALLYTVSSLDGEFKFGPLCEIPAVPFLLDERSSVSFCKYKSSIVRSVSVSFSLGEKDCSLWKPHVSIWSIPARASSDISIYSSTLFGEGGFPSCPIAAEQISVRSFEKKPIEIAQNGESSNNGVLMDKRIVSTSLVLSEGSYTPYAVVYGFFNGDIRVVQFSNLSQEVSSPSESQKHEAEVGTSGQFFTGHSGAVLCLAARCIPMNSTDQRVSRVLVSGSTDCTIRIWDLDLGHPLSILHHHVGPVKQILLPSLWTDHPWNNCFLSVGDDCCVALVSLETLRVERMFPGHPVFPSMVAWDSTRGYVACLTGNISSQLSSSPSPSSSSSNLGSLLYIWDVKSGARERIIKGTAACSMFDHFCRGINMNSVAGNILGVSTSASLLLLPFIDDPNSTQLHVKKNEKGNITMSTTGVSHMRSREPPEVVKGKLSPQILNHSSDLAESNSTTDLSSHQIRGNMPHPVKSTCPFTGIASVEVDLSSLMTIHFAQSSDKQVIGPSIEHDIKGPDLQQGASTDKFDIEEIEILESCLLRLSLSFLHLWDVDKELDKLLMEEMNVCKPDGFHIASGVIGDRGSLTLMFPGLHANLQLWKSSSEFCAMRSLAIVSIAQRLISLSHANTAASSALAAFYTRNFAERVPDIKPPSLQLLVSFWQDPSEHVRMAARSLFHCAAPRAIPHALSNHKTIQLENPLNVLQGHIDSDKDATSLNIGEAPERPAEMVSSELDKSIMMTWLDSFEDHEWISWIGGTNQDGMASHIVVAAALVVWYPSLVKEGLANLVVNQLIKLVMSMNDRYSSTAAELLAEGMDNTWKTCLGPEIPHLVGDIFFQIELLTGSPLNNATEKLALAVNMREALVEILLPSLAMADIAGFLNVVEGQIWATSSDSPVHLVSLKTLIRVVRGSPKPLAPYLDKVVNYVLQTMDPGNLVMRKSCLKSSLTALREITRVFPMVAMNESSTRLAIGDAIGDIRNVTIRVYDIESVTKIKILDASAPLGLPSFLEGASNPKLATAISALSFSPDGEGLVAFSENGLMIRWWSLGTGWWEKLSRNLVPVQCTKLIFVPPWEGFSPNSSRSSIMASMLGHTKKANSQGSPREVDDADRLRVLLHNLDLSYRLQWVGGRNVLLTRHGQELGTFPL